MSPGTVLFDGSLYRMWYIAVKYNGSWGTWSFGHATSPDGLAWTKDPQPVLEPTELWEGNHVYYPEVLPFGSGYAMWYSAFDVSANVGIGFAVSADGNTWGKWPANPALEPTPPCTVAETMVVIADGDTFHGWLDHCQEIHHVTSPFETLFFDTFETGDASIWSTVVP